MELIKKETTFGRRCR